MVEQELPISSAHADLSLAGTPGGAVRPRDQGHVDPDPVPVTEARHESDDQDLVREDMCIIKECSGLHVNH